MYSIQSSILARPALAVLLAACILVSPAVTRAADAHAHAADAPKAPPPAESLRKLMEGNRRFVRGRSAHPDQSVSHRKLLAQGQHPFAIVIGCADSRVGPEVILDQGLGSLFVIRVAGNIVDEVALGSIEYAVEHLGASLIVVLGHERCGAVDAAVQGAVVHNHVAALIQAIKPAVEQSKAQPGDPLDNAVRAHVQNVARQLKTSKPLLADLVGQGRIRIEGARYDLDTGTVEILP